MAQTISKVPDEAVSVRYSYDRYFNGDLWELIPGEDCPASIRSAQTSIRNAARRQKIKCRVSQSKKANRIYIQAEVRPTKKRKAR